MPIDPIYEYFDEYSTCLETFAGLRVFSDALSPQDISSLLRLEASHSYVKGSKIGRSLRVRSCHGWFLESLDHVQSRDNRRHVDFLLAKLEGSAAALDTIRGSAGAHVDVLCYYVSSGQGGPWLMPTQLRGLADLGLEIWWDIYFDRRKARRYRGKTRMYPNQ